MPRKRLYGKEKLKMFAVALPPSMREEMTQAAYAEHMDVSSWIRKLISDGIAKSKKVVKAA